MRALFLSLALILCAPLAHAQTSDPCGATDHACEIDGGEYFIALPDRDVPKGAVVFLHGWGGQGAGIMNNASLRDNVLNRGYAFVAPNGTPRSNGNGRSWSFHPDLPIARDDIGFLADVMADLPSRHGVPAEHILLGGFSAGGFMTSYLACATPDAASAYVPVSGGFWRPHPQGCAGPVRLFHTHGWADTVVPLEGRLLRNGTLAQGDIFHGMDLWRQANGCTEMAADRTSTEGTFWLRGWDRCAPGSALEFALFPGGHSIPRGWTDMVLDWYEALPSPK